jgi:PAS domain S-box-containing protein
LETFEVVRRTALDRLALPGTPSEHLFESLAELASLTFNTPIALIYLNDEQRHRIKARIGLDVEQIIRDISTWHDVIIDDNVLVVSDAAEDGRFSDNPLVTGSPHIRFYAGAPLITPEGHRVGTICVFDEIARSFADDDVVRLQTIAKSVVAALPLRTNRQEHERLASVLNLQTKLLTLAEDMAGVGTWSWDVAADRTTWSDQVYRIHGYEPAVEPPALQGVLDRYHPDDAKLLAIHVQRAVGEGVDYALEARVYRPDGAERHVVARGACRKDADGRVSALVGTFQDITEHVAAEKFIRYLADHLPGLVSYWDTELRCRFATAAYEDWFGHSPERMSDVSLPELLGMERFAEVEHFVVAALGGATQTFSKTLVKRDGTISHTVTYYIPDISSSGLTQGFYVLVSDVTALKRAEEKLIHVAAEREKFIDKLTTLSVTRGEVIRQLGEREVELRQASQRHKQLINGVKDYAIYWLDPTGHVESWNVGAQKMKGYDETEIVGAQYSIFFTAVDRAAGEPERILATAVREGKCTAEGWRVRKDGTTFWSEVSVEAVWDDANVLIGFAKLSRDVTERRELERDRQAAHDRLQLQEVELREANRLLLMAEKISRTGHWRLDIVKNTVVWSDVVCAIHGRPSGYVPSLEEAVEVYHPDDLSTVQHHINRALATGVPFEYNARIIRTDGAVRQVLARGRTEVAPDGSVKAMFGVFHDITEASRQQQALAASEEKYELTLKGMSVGVWDWDIVNSNLYWSEKFLELMGLDKNISLDFNEFAGRLHPDDRENTLNSIQEHLERKRVYDLEYRLRHGRGHYIWIHATGQAIWNETGEPRRMSGSATDITEFKHQQQALIESEETFRRAIENAVVGNALVASDGRWLTVNRAFCELVGYDEAEILRAGTTLVQAPGEPWNIDETVEVLMSGRSNVVEGERRLCHSDGHLLWVNVSASLVTRDGGATDYLVVQFQDLTERKRSDLMKDEFVSTVSHELRTPLTSLFGSLRLLSVSTAGKLDPKSERLLQVAQTSSTLLTGLVDDILDIEKIAAGKMDYRLKTLAAQPLISEIIVRHQSLADLHKITFKTQLNIEGLAIRVDPSRFAQALLNLLSNAAKYSAAGDQVDILAERDGEAAIRISVTDHGPGIPNAFRSKIFGRFAQADNSTTRKVGGTGLGLNITKTLIEAFGGTVSFDSVEGHGATFHIVVPACEMAATELELEVHD